MLTASNSKWQHAGQNISLITISILFLPLNTLFAILAWLSLRLVHSQVELHRNATRQQPSFRPRTILITGVGMSKGLVLARIFYKAGHNVIGADFESIHALVCGRVSKSLARFYPLLPPSAADETSEYIINLLTIIKKEKIELWISCSGVASAVQDGLAKEIIEARTLCKAVQFDLATTEMLHDKDKFISYARDQGLTVPETHNITSLQAAQAALERTNNGIKYIMKPVGVDDARRGDMTLLPKSSRKATLEHLARLQISEKCAWILQQYISGPEYCTHALVVRGQVKAFVACPSAELLMHYEALPGDSPEAQAMLKFTEAIAADQGQNFTGHLSFDFMIEANLGERNDNYFHANLPVIYPIECNPRAHTAAVLFNETDAIVAAYLELLDKPPMVNPNSDYEIVVPVSKNKYYWIGHDFVSLLLRPLRRNLTGESSASPSNELQKNIEAFFDHLVHWRDGTFERWDPWPWWWLYHVFWPLQFWQAFWNGTKWSRINVSTTKMFMC